jgi:formate--tetrahydrofolate ligase
VRLCDEPSDFRFSYDTELSVTAKIDAIATKIYHAADVSIAPEAIKQIAVIEQLGFGKLPVCMAKTQYSFSDDPSLLGAPDGFTLTVRGVKISAGAEFVVALTGDIMTMPGLPKNPAAENIDVDADGRISGLF